MCCPTMHLLSIKGGGTSARCRLSVIALTCLLFVSGLALGVAPAEAAPAAADVAETATPGCEPRTLELPSGRIEGDLCLPSSPSSTLIITVSGGSYSRIYWDFPYEPESYSFTRAMVERGHPVFNIDRLGIGESEHPPSVQMTVQLGGQSLHEVISAARAGDLGPEFTNIVLAGHSLGTGLAEYEIARYQDVDALIATGLAHNFNEITLAQAVSSFQPVALDPQFADSGIDPTYFTTRPGTRESSFYASEYVDPEVVALDEATKATVSAGEFATLTQVLGAGLIGGGPVCTLLGALCQPAEEILLGPTNSIRVPVLFVMGDQDSLNCGPTGSDCSSAAALRAAEAPYWRGSPCFTVSMVENAGHDINLHIGGDAWFDVADQWLSSLEPRPGGGLDCG